MQVLPLVGADGWAPSSFTELAQHYLRMKRSYGGKIVPGAMDSAAAKHLVGSYGGLAPRVALIAQVCSTFLFFILLPSVNLLISSKCQFVNSVIGYMVPIWSQMTHLSGCCSWLLKVKNMNLGAVWFTGHLSIWRKICSSSDLEQFSVHSEMTCWQLSWS